MAARADKKINEETIEKKLMSFNNTQDSVQGMSLWIMHNKAHHQKIVDTWLKVLKKCEVKHKLTLFYLCNDVVQHAKKKKALYYLENFKDNLREAVQVIRELDSIKPNIGRIFKIWEDRRTYDAKFITELRGIMAGENAADSGGSSSKNSSASVTPITPITPAQVSPAPAYKPSSKDAKTSDKDDKTNQKDKQDSSRILAEFKPSMFVDQISSLKRQESEVGLKTKQLTTLRIDATNIEAVKQLKDRSHGVEFCKQFEESCNKIEDYVTMLEKEIKQRKLVLSFCDEAELFYDEQFSEARIVANAYKNFGARITNMKKRVDDMKKIIPSTPSPVPSPSADAPSPGNTPPLQDMDDNDMVDMDLSEEETDSKKGTESRGTVMPGRMAYTAMVKSIAQPIASLTNITVGEKASAASEEPYNPETPAHDPEDSFPGSNILESRIATMLPNLAKGSSNLGLQMPASSQQALIPDYVPPKPVRQETSDDRASTPVMDEQEEKEPSPIKPPPKAKTPPVSKIKTNPIDFLSQLLTKSSNTSSSSNFLHSLSLLTNTVKNQYQKQQQQQSYGEDTSKGSTSTSSAPMASAAQSTAFSAVPPPEPVTQTSTWSAWKTVNTPVQPPLPQQPEPPSPPVLPTVKPPNYPPQPPPPQHPPPPPEPTVPRQMPISHQQYPIQPPSPVDFSLPPPTTSVSRSYLPPQPVSQPYAGPPPLNVQPFSPQGNGPRPRNVQSFTPQASATQPFPPQSSASQPFPPQANVTQSFNSRTTSSLDTSPTTLRPTVPGLGFNPSYPFGIVPPREPLPRGPAPPPAPGMSIIPQPPPPSGYMQGAQITWDQPRSVPADAAPPINQSHMPGAYAPPPPPPPPDTSAPPPWQQDRPPPHPPQGQQTLRGYGNQISAVPALRSEWDPPVNNEYEDNDPWEQQDADDDDPSSGYAHPWDQPQNYEGEDEDNDVVDALTPNPLPPAPKSILRNSRSSSLREVTLVDDRDSNNIHKSSHTLPQQPIFPAANEKKTPPIGILKKPMTEVLNTVSDVQSEFIAKLKQKSGGGPNDTPPPPSNRNFTTVSLDESVLASVVSSGDVKNSGKGEAISTIGVIGSNGRTSSVKSDDMEIDNDEPSANYDASNESDWAKTEDESSWAEDTWQEERQQISYEYDRGGPVPRPRDPEPHMRPRAPRPYGGFDSYQPRGYQHRPQHFQDNYRGGPSPAKRPYFSPRPRMPYYRY